MKPVTKLRLACMALLFVSASFSTQAQQSKEIPSVGEGFWVIETVPKSQQCTVRFYTDGQKMIYEETLNKRLNIYRRQTKRRLNAALEQALFAWNTTHQVSTDRQWVVLRLRKK